MSNVPVLILPLKFNYKGALSEGCLSFSRIPNGGTAEIQTAGILHERELARFSGYKFEARRKTYLGGRIAAKQSLMYLLKERDPRLLEISSGVFDQPITHPISGANFEVSISHCGDHACAVAFPAGFQVGIDLGSISDFAAEKREAVRQQFTRAELLAVDGIETDRQDTVAMMLWTMKECLSKSLKCGLMTPLALLETTEFNFAPQGKSTCKFKNFPQYGCASFLTQSFVFSMTASVDMTISGIDINLIAIFLG